MAKKRLAGPGGQPRYHHGDLRRAIVRAALELIAGSGLEHLSLREISRKIGVTTAAPYHHFRDRDALLIEIGVQGFRELLGRLEEARGKDQAGPEELEAEAHAYLCFAREQSSVYRVMFSSEVANQCDWPELKSTADRCFGIVCATVAATTGMGARESAEAALCIWATLHGLTVLDQSRFLLEEPSEQERIAVQGVLGLARSYGVPTAPRLRDHH